MARDSHGSRLSVWLLLVPLFVGLLAVPALAKKKQAGRKPQKMTRERERLIELGRRLFFDPMVSRTGTVACATCHIPEHGFSDTRRFSPDETGMSGRHSQPILDSASNPTSHWDGEFDGGAEDLVLNRLGRVMVYYGTVSLPPPSTTSTRPTRPGRTGRGRPTTGGPLAAGGVTPSPVTPGAGPAMPTIPTPVTPRPTPRVAAAAPGVRLSEFVAEAVEGSDRYDEAFRAAFGSPRVTLHKLAEAMAEYCHSIESTESPFDRFNHGEEEAISEEALRGNDLFHGRAGCASCHSTEGKHPLLTDFEFHNTGIAWRVQPDESGVGDPGRERFSGQPVDRRAFKTPSLRDLTRRGPYMHDGSFTTLEQVVQYYADGASGDPEQDERIRGFEASEQDVADLVAFLETLTGDTRPGLATDAWKGRAKETRLRFVNHDGKPIAGLPIRLVPAGDTIPVDGHHRVSKDAVTFETDNKGWIEFEPLAWTHARIELHDGLLELQNPLIPDTLRKAVITVPIDSKIEIVVVAPRAEFAPARLTLGPASGQSFSVLRGRRAVPVGHMSLRRLSTIQVAGKVVAKYEGWLLPGVENVELELKVPGLAANDPTALRIRFGKERTGRIDLTE